jgi:hypothetical protein
MISRSVLLSVFPRLLLVKLFCFQEGPQEVADNLPGLISALLLLPLGLLVDLPAGLDGALAELFEMTLQGLLLEVLL